ncbi:MAG: hypothetical protein SFT93_05980 [Rickettsiaceae bacterium]|nr:hypothetical protein [Rickettsiaceae bacterium]
MGFGIIYLLWADYDTKESDYELPKEEFLENVLARYFCKAKVIDEEVENIISLANGFNKVDGADDFLATLTTPIFALLAEIKDFKEKRELEIRNLELDRIKTAKFSELNNLKGLFKSEVLNKFPDIAYEELRQEIIKAPLSTETLQSIENEIREHIKRTLYHELSPIFNICLELQDYNKHQKRYSDYDDIKFSKKERRAIEQNLSVTNEQGKTFFETRKDLFNPNQSSTFEDKAPSRIIENGLFILAGVSLVAAVGIVAMPVLLPALGVLTPVVIASSIALVPISGACMYFGYKEKEENQRYYLARDTAKYVLTPKKFEERNSMEYDEILDERDKAIGFVRTAFTAQAQRDDSARMGILDSIKLPNQAEQKQKTQEAIEKVQTGQSWLDDPIGPSEWQSLEHTPSGEAATQPNPTDEQLLQQEQTQSGDPSTPKVDVTNVDQVSSEAQLGPKQQISDDPEFEEGRGMIPNLPKGTLGDISKLFEDDHVSQSPQASSSLREGRGLKLLNIDTNNTDQGDTSGETTPASEGPTNLRGVSNSTPNTPNNKKKPSPPNYPKGNPPPPPKQSRHK